MAGVDADRQLCDGLFDVVVVSEGAVGRLESTGRGFSGGVDIGIDIGIGNRCGDCIDRAKSRRLSKVEVSVWRYGS